MAKIYNSPSDWLVTCPPQVLEYCYSAPLGKYDEYKEFITLGFPLEKTPTEKDVLNIQQSLWKSGYFRSVRTVDILIAAYAILNDAVVLSSDHDYEYIAKVTDLQQEYIAPT